MNTRAVTRAEWQAPLPEEVPEPIGRGIPVGLAPKRAHEVVDPDPSGIAVALRGFTRIPDCRVDLAVKRRTSGVAPADTSVYDRGEADLNIHEIAEIMDGDLQQMVSRVQAARPHRCESCGLQHAEQEIADKCCALLYSLAKPEKKPASGRRRLTDEEIAIIHEMVPTGATSAEICDALGPKFGRVKGEPENLFRHSAYHTAQRARRKKAKEGKA